VRTCPKIPPQDADKDAGWFRTLPLQLTWFSSAFYLIGGGPIVATAIAITMVSDIVPPDKRTTVFLYLTASFLVAEMIAPILGAWLMDYGDWLPLLLALAIQQFGIMVAAFFPETLHLRDLPEPKDIDGVSEPVVQAVDKESMFSVNGQLRDFKDAILFLKRDFTLALVISTFFSSRLGRQALTMLIRYATKRYRWSIQKVGSTSILYTPN
jgi:MFS family permease